MIIHRFNNSNPALIHKFIGNIAYLASMGYAWLSGPVLSDGACPVTDIKLGTLCRAGLKLVFIHDKGIHNFILEDQVFVYELQITVSGINSPGQSSI
ncbi:MAG: hypothetical protein R6U68_13250 [Desulfobacteraceae bacterium]